MSNAVRFLGTTDEVDVCDCCGRKGLKSTVALSFDEGEVVYYGVTCAARALSRTVKEVRSEARAADDAKHARELAERNAKHATEFAAWSAWCAVNGEGKDLFSQIQSLGGGKAARERFKSENGQ